MTSETTEPAALTAEIGLRWGDMDAYGHVNNVQYHRLLEEARIRAFAEWFHSSGGERMLRSGVLLARQEIEYREPVVLRREPVVVDVWVTRVGGSSVDLGYVLHDNGATTGGERAVHALAATTMVQVDLRTSRPKAFDEGQREVLERHLGPEVPFRKRG